MLIRSILFILLISLPVYSFQNSEESSVIIKSNKFDILHQNEIRSVSKPIVYTDGILFTFAMENVKSVFVSGTFVKWVEHIELKKNDFGIYFRFYKRNFTKGTFTYRYFVDGIWMNDPMQPLNVDDGYGTRISAFELKLPLSIYDKTPVLLKNGKFKFLLKNKDYKKVSWVGSKNSWDPYVDVMALNEEGFWEIELEISSDRIFYKFYVDGKTVLDPLNPNITRTGSGEDVNFVPLRKIGEKSPR